MEEKASFIWPDSQDTPFTTSNLFDPKEEIPDEILCLICQDFVNQPQECSICSYLFCNSCLNDWLQKSQECPMKCNNPQYTEPHKIYKAMLNKVKFKCKNVVKGCKEQITVDGYRIHIKECKFQKDQEAPRFLNSQILYKSKLEKSDYKPQPIGDSEPLLLLGHDYYYKEGMRWIRMDNQLSDLLDEEYQEGQKKEFQITFPFGTYKFDFNKMMQQNVKTKFERPFKRESRVLKEGDKVIYYFEERQYQWIRMDEEISKFFYQKLKDQEKVFKWKHQGQEYQIDLEMLTQVNQATNKKRKLRREVVRKDQGTWGWQDDDGTYKPYANQIQTIIAKFYEEFKNQKKNRQTIKIKSQLYYIDFDSSTQINVTTKFHRAIKLI